MINLENSKFNVGDKVFVKDAIYRGDWLSKRLAGGTEVKYTGKDKSGYKLTTVTRVLKRKEPSLNGEREEYYYEVSDYPNGRFREDLLEGECSDDSCIEYRSGFYASEAMEIRYRTKAKCFTKAEMQKMLQGSFSSEDF